MAVAVAIHEQIALEIVKISRGTQLVLIQFAKYSPNFALYATFILVSMYIRICTLATAEPATLATLGTPPYKS